MKMKFIFNLKWTFFACAILYLNFVLMLTSGTDNQMIFFLLSIFLLSVIVLFDYRLRKKLGMHFDFIMLGILFGSALQFMSGMMDPPILGIIPSIIVIVFIIFKYLKIRKTEFQFEKKETLSFFLSLYLISFTLVSLSLLLKTYFLYLLIGFIPLYLMSSYLLISNFKEFEKRQYLLYFSVLTYILLFFNTTLEGSGYNIFFQINIMIPTLIILMHLLWIRSVCQKEIDTIRIRKKKVKKIAK